ncbi:MAG: heavy-metal-associated domain-containing protein [Ferruginibacter sp.]
MKTLSICAVILFSVFSTSQSFAQTSISKETFKVWGNCGMCKKTIEKSAITAGAKTASWNEETHQLQVSYSSAKTSGNKIQQAIAASGYDTQDLTASNKAYNNLHSCCQYERKEGAAINTTTKACCSNEHCAKGVTACQHTDGCKDQSCCKM